MPPRSPSLEERWNDAFQALDFADRRFADWLKANLLQAAQLEALQRDFATRRQKWEADRAAQAEPPDSQLAPLVVGESPAACSLRYWTFLAREVRRLAKVNDLSLSQKHDLLDEIQSHVRVLERRLAPDELPEALPVEDAEESAPRKPVTPSQPRRNFLERPGSKVPHIR